VIDVFPSLEKRLLPKVASNKDLCFETCLRDKLLKKRIGFFEFSGRLDSVFIDNQYYPASTMHTKAQDLDAAISYIYSNIGLKMKIILLGASEGGMSCVIAASKRADIYANILLAVPGVTGEQFIDYQQSCADTIALGTFGSSPEGFKMLIGNPCNTYEHSIRGFKRYRKEAFEPLEEIISRHESYKTIAIEIKKLLMRKWKFECSSLKTQTGNFDSYCQSHMYNTYITPQQIALRKWKPELYFPKIKCPILSVNGTHDKKVEHSSTINSIRKLLTENGNNKFSTLILEGYDHSLRNDRITPSIDMESVDKVVEWILKQ
jgi:pimeloyl-ACP methyl ester carboxylesterase